MRSAVLVAAAVCWVCQSPAAAQMRVGTASFTWQASIDDGATWREGAIDAAADTSVLVRSLVAWSVEPPTGIAFGTARFDVAVSEAGAADRIGSIGYGPFGTGVRSTLAATRFGSTLKIDDVRDTMPPGLGDWTVQPSQLSPQFDYPIDRRNPAPVFCFRLRVDGTPGDRTVSALRATPFPGGNPFDRFIMLYYGAGGSHNLPLSSYGGDLLVRVVPAPAACLIAALGVLPLMCRRRPGEAHARSPRR